MALFMKPVFGVTGEFLSYEFASSRGAIHFHSNLYAKYDYKCEGYLNNSADDEISLSLDKYPKSINEEIKKCTKRFLNLIQNTNLN